MKALALAALVVLACGDGGRPRPVAVITISATWPGASVQAVENSILMPLEQAVGEVKGIGDLTSRAEAGVATIVADVQRGQDARLVALQMSRALQAAHARLPADVLPAEVRTARADDRPAITLAIEGDLPPGALGVIARRDVARALERLVGVGRIELRGFRSPAVVLVPDLERLVATRTTVLELAKAVTSANVTVPGGRVDSSGAVLHVQGAMTDLESLQDLVVGQVGDVPVRVRDVAVVLDDFIRAPEGGPAQIDVHAQLGVLRMDVAETVRKQLPNLSLPLGVKVTEVPAKSLPAAKQLAVSIVGMDLDELARLADAAIADAKAAGIAGVERDPSPGTSEVVLDADRDRAARYGITSADLAETLRLATDDARVGELRLDGEQWPVLMRLSTRDLPTRVTKLFVRSGIGGLVPLNELVAVSNRMATPILRRNRVRAIDLVAPTESVGKVRAIVERAAAKWPEGYRAARPR